MTQDEREQKMEAYNPSQYETITQANNRMSAELSRLKAMTEGGVWISREDAKALELLTDAYCHDDLDLIDIRNRLRAKLDGNHDA